MAKKKKVFVKSTMFVCDKEGCHFSTGEEVIDPAWKTEGKDKKTPTQAIAAGLYSPRYGTVSVEDGETANCPVCGKPLTVVEDDRHKWLRLNVKTVTHIAEALRQMNGRTRSSQYGPENDDLERLDTILCGLLEEARSTIVQRIDRNTNGTDRKSRSAARRKPTIAI